MWFVVAEFKASKKGGGTQVPLRFCMCASHTIFTGLGDGTYILAQEGLL